METAAIVGVRLKNDSSRDTSMAELERLCATAGCRVVKTYLVRVEKFNPATFIGQGKAQEISLFAAENKLDAVIFNDEISPAQQNNLEEIIPAKIIDRTRLILDIFAQRARTKEGELQVELAQLNYLLPRLSGRGAAMMQQQGGIGMRGPGERKLEYDRRRLRTRISKLEGEIEAVKKERQIRRARRGEVPLPQIAIAGYTNAGKSTLLNALTRQNAAYADDKLFATLDPVTRRVKLPGGLNVLFTDTVGFIQKLPHSLVSAFRATLEEVKFADIILHLIDSSSRDMEAQSETVHKIINELEVKDIPVIDAYNKIDTLGAVKLKAMQNRFKDGVFISAVKGGGFDKLFTAIEAALSIKWQRRQINFAPGQEHLLHIIYERALVLTRKDSGAGIKLDALITEGNYKSILDMLKRAG